MTEQPMDPVLAAFAQLVTYMAVKSGVAGVGSTIHPAGADAWEVRVAGQPIGVVTRGAILELAEQIRSRRN